MGAHGRVGGAGGAERGPARRALGAEGGSRRRQHPHDSTPPRFRGRQGPELGAWNYADAIFTGYSGNDFAGYSVDGLGDWDGDGLDDVAIGANQAGVYVVAGGSTLTRISNSL